MTSTGRVLPPRALIGMVHLAPLPGSPASEHSLIRIVSQACADACTLQQAGFDALMIENFGDAPFRSVRVDPHTIACMTIVARAVRQAVALPLGINVLRNDSLAAIAIANTCGAAFVRVNVHCGAYATDQGVIEGRADETLRYRSRIGAARSGDAHGANTGPPAVSILADVHVKHATPLSSQPIGEAGEEVAYRGRADGLIVSGSGTGKPTDLADLRAVREAVPDRPMLVGSGATTSTVRDLLSVADGVIVGTSVKQQGRTTAPVDSALAQAFVLAARR